MKKIQIQTPQGDFFFTDYEKINITQEDEGCILTIRRANQKEEIFTCHNHWNMKIVSTDDHTHMTLIHFY